MGELNFSRLLSRTRMYGDKLAVQDIGNGYLSTYREHISRIGHICAVLRSLGVRPNDRVAVLADASHIYVELWRACLSGAGVVTPLNTRLAADELVYILNDSSAEILFVGENYAAMIDGLRERLPVLRQVVLIDDSNEPSDVRLVDLLAASSPEPLPPEPDDDAPAALMYTGGTTGLQKGVLLSQKAITLTIYRVQMAVGYKPESRYLAFMPMFHVASIAAWGLLVPTGGATIIIPEFEPGAVLSSIQEHQINFIGAVPTMLQMLVSHPDYVPGMLSSLENVIYGAAPMPPELLKRLLDEYPNLSFNHTYGMTECAATATALQSVDHHRGDDLLGSVGRPCIGVELDIRDPETASPVETGKVGEIWIRSNSLMIEYWNKPEQTASSLVDGWYRTGDAGRVDDEGFLFLADRIKDMIVTGGENVYSLEVENAISSHPTVIAVAVIGLPHAVWGEQVHAIVVCEPDAVSAEELAEHARESIAGYKVPKGWTLQSEPLPLSAAGKVLKHRLRDLLAAELT